MSSPLDPYHKWLGISPKDQPPDSYRLLGIDRFESDGDVIASAADRQMVHVRSFQTGQHSDLSQKLLNEIAAAKVCLLNAQKKEEYDRQLRQRLEPPVPKPLPIAEPSSSGEPLEPRPAFEPKPQPNLPAFSLRDHLRRKSQSWQVIAAVGAAVIVLAFVITLTVVSGTSQDTGEEEASAEHETPLPPPEEEQPAEKPETDPFEHLPTQPANKSGEAQEPKQPEPSPTPPDEPVEPTDSPAPKTETVEEAAQRLREQFDRSTTEADFAGVAKALLVVSDRAIIAGSTDLAKELLTLALTASRNTNDTELKKTVALRFVELEKPLEEVQKAAEERLKEAAISVGGPLLPDVSP